MTTNKQLKTIIAKENRMKDPFRVKKNVTFVIALDDSADEESGDERSQASPEKREEEST